MSQPYRISFIGSGNVATHLAIALKSAGHSIDTIVSRNAKNAKALAEKVKSSHSNSLSDITGSTELVIIAANDDGISSIANELNSERFIVAHTSGSVDMNALKGSGDTIGVFYPLQTFHKEKNVDMMKVPFCIEGANENVEVILLDIANSISDSVQLITSEQRKVLHVAAVFACNFTNHFYSISEEILKEKQMSLDLLRPLILETASQVLLKSPKALQTGPAVRKDEKVIGRHLDYLKETPEYQRLYELLTKSIQNSFKAS